VDAGLLIARLVLGLAICAHRAQKLFGWFGGYGPKGTGGFFESLGFRPGVFFAVAAGELVGGLLAALGFLGSISPALIILVMLVAVIADKEGFHGHRGDKSRGSLWRPLDPAVRPAHASTSRKQSRARCPRARLV
jgi:uncharacterized membrane protein YphA (DoxX/SURF4 family)